MPSTCFSRCSSPSCTAIWNGTNSSDENGPRAWRGSQSVNSLAAVCELAGLRHPLQPALPCWDGNANVPCARSDYINPIDLCNRLNQYILPEVAVHGFLTFLFLINGYWLPLILNLPLLGWNVKKCVAPTGPSNTAGKGRADWMQDRRQHTSSGCH